MGGRSARRRSSSPSSPAPRPAPPTRPSRLPLFHISPHPSPPALAPHSLPTTFPSPSPSLFLLDRRSCSVRRPPHHIHAAARAPPRGAVAARRCRDVGGAAGGRGVVHRAERGVGQGAAVGAGLRVRPRGRCGLRAHPVQRPLLPAQHPRRARLLRLQLHLPALPRRAGGVRLRRHRHRHAHRPQSVRLLNRLSLPHCSMFFTVPSVVVSAHQSVSGRHPFCFCFSVRSWSTSSVSFALRNHTQLNWSLFFFANFGGYISVCLFLTSFPSSSG